ncbi:hypothetical protein [Methylovulum psychrotolerans]|uniref:Uncharacterized protein n=1 Tax=Methylovulum psychrotolerans TaxID=1704499 RepID=A0A2S5CR51_9GAMM|nr:hypothetical protein [Methylovulum psychrotolerans]POZ53311.1 hypothetical protein AADEFJLK_00331 [Methylovulum psychrotolerans]
MNPKRKKSSTQAPLSPLDALACPGSIASFESLAGTPLIDDYEHIDWDKLQALLDTSVALGVALRSYTHVLAASQVPFVRVLHAFPSQTVGVKPLYNAEFDFCVYLERSISTLRAVLALKPSPAPKSPKLPDSWKLGDKGNKQAEFSRDGIPQAVRCNDPDCTIKTTCPDCGTSLIDFKG